MANEEMHKAMEFIVQQEAQASAKIDALAEAQKVADERWNERWTRTEEGIRALLSIAEIHEREIASLGQSVAVVSDNSRKTDERIAALSENGRATDVRLNALISVVERQISEGRNGKP